VSRLDELTSELERVAERLREGELAPEEAADLVEECARLAAAAASELDRAARDAQ
jgi:exonuclease VII small subunit